MILPILIILLIILFCSVRYLKNRNESMKIKEPDFQSQFMLKIVNKYYISNILLTLFSIFIYFFFTIFIFILLRYIAIGSSSNIQILLESFKAQSLILVILLLLCITYFHKLIELLCYTEIIKLHFYLNQYTWYIRINDFQRDNFFFIDNMLSHKWLFLYQLTEPIEYVLERYNEHTKFNSLSSYTALQTVLKLHNIIHSNRTLFLIISWLQYALFILSRHTSGFLYYIPHSLVCITLIYEIYQGELHYIYHILFIYVITSAIKKIRKFLHEKDPLLDNIMSSYLYKNSSIPYEKIQKVLEMSGEKTRFDIQDIQDICTPEMQQILYNEELFVYLQNDYKVYYILDPIRAMNSNLIKKKYRRIHVMLLLLLGCLFLLYNNNIYSVMIKCLNIEVSIIIILLPILALPILHTRINMIFQEEEFTIKQNTKYYITFLSVTLFYTIILLILILKHKLIPSNEGILMDWIVTITQQLTVQEKITFLYEYLTYQLNKVNASKELSIIISQIDFTTLIDNNTSLQTIKDYVDNLILTYFSQERIYINNFIDIIKSVIPKQHNSSPQPIVFLRNTIIILTCSYVFKNIHYILKIALQLTKNEKIVEIITNIIKGIF